MIFNDTAYGKKEVKKLDIKFMEVIELKLKTKKLEFTRYLYMINDTEIGLIKHIEKMYLELKSYKIIDRKIVNKDYYFNESDHDFTF